MPKFSGKKLAMIALLLDEEKEGKKKKKQTNKQNVGERNDQREEQCK